MDDLTLTIEIPPDSDGFIPMECPLCEERFGLRIEDIEDDEVLEVRCPHCGIASDSYVTPNIIELAQTKLSIMALNLIHNEMKKLERATKGKAIEVKAGKKPQEEAEAPLVTDVNTMQEIRCENCGRTVKVTPLLALSVFICPCCGVSNIHG